MPKTEGMKNFPSTQDDLSVVPVEKWRQFIFASLAPNFEFRELIRDVEERVGWMPIENFAYREDLSKEYHVKANWALYCDNYLEGFHVPHIHKGLAKKLDHKTYETITLENAVLQIANGNTNNNVLQNSEKLEQNLYGLYYWIFPNLMLNFYSWGLSINITSIASQNITYSVLHLPEFK